MHYGEFLDAVFNRRKVLRTWESEQRDILSTLIRRFTARESFAPTRPGGAKKDGDGGGRVARPAAKIKKPARDDQGFTGIGPGAGGQTKWNSLGR